MSKSTEKPATSDQSSYTAPVDALLDRFDALVKHAQKLASPPRNKGVAAPPDMTHWSILRRTAFTIYSPLPTMFRIESLPIFFMILSISLFISQLWLMFADVSLDYIFGGSLPKTSSNLEIPIYINVVFCAVVIMLAVAAYWRWIEFFRDCRYSKRWRLILALGFVAIAFSFPYWAFRPEYRAQFPLHLLEDNVDLILFAIMYIFFLIPPGTFYYMLVIDTAVFGRWLLLVIGQYFVSAHDPFPKKSIREIVLEPIPSSGGKEEWRLTELTKAELESLRTWAEANREGTEKRLLPTLVLFGILAVFANIQVFSHAMDQVLTWLSKLLSKPAVFSPLSILGSLLQLSVFTFVVGLPIAIFIYSLVLLFRNLVTQSLIIEACIVAEHVREQHRSVDSSIETITGHKGFWQRLINLFQKL